ncbi:MAG: cation diffusion facilitator CzcD-associated flavoprotein CzcO [Paracoccaceae bacterium]|jgi:cation diffusion facilitator CzcD-associated flavoprotein CzcO
MTKASAATVPPQTAREHQGVVIIGAGISGIGQACHLKDKRPGTSFVMLEGRDRIGGTWDLFRYPGIRSDSDMYTFGYSFRPWTDKNDIASGDAILRYLDGTVKDYGLREKIRFGSRVTRVNWSPAQARWLIDVTPADGAPYEMSCDFLVSCTGYYDYEQGYLPDFEGFEDFKGAIAHPQHWPEDLDYAGKRVLVIGSGATAVTLVPAMAKTATHVTMLQRSPTYIFSRPARDPKAAWLRRWLPAGLAHRLARARAIFLSTYAYRIARKNPEGMRAFLRKMAIDEAGPDVDVDTHFKPSYAPWDQRLCLIPDGDFYAALRAGDADVVTDKIARFTQTGVTLASGKTLAADVIVPATGLKLQFLGGIDMQIDGVPVKAADHTIYRGTMLSNVPNFAMIFGYANSSWTLKADLSSGFICRVLRHMTTKGAQSVTPRLDPASEGAKPLLSLTSGYLARAADEMPKQGEDAPWKTEETYISDMLSVRFASVDDGVLAYA